MAAKWTHEKYESELFRKEIDAYPIEKYSGYDTPILHACIEGHETLRAPGNVLRGLKCIKCSNTWKASHSDYVDKLYSKSIAEEILPVESYINTDTPIIHTCSKGHEWKAAPKHILEGRGCPECANKTGFYCESFFNNNPEAGKQPGILYCVVLVDKKTDERVCIKIGITKGTSNKDVLKRVSHFKGYETRIQKLVFGTLEEIYYLEQYLHEKWAHKKYTSKWKFGGYSELFEMDDEIIRSVPKTP